MTTELLVQLRDAGLNISRSGDQIIVMPRQRLTDDLRAAIRSGKIALLAALAAESRSPAADPADERPQTASLSPIQEAARADVLAQLARNPAAQRAFTNRFEPDGSMIVTLAIRGVATGELKIAAEQSHQACRALISGMGGALATDALTDQRTPLTPTGETHV